MTQDAAKRAAALLALSTATLSDGSMGRILDAYVDAAVAEAVKTDREKWGRDHPGCLAAITQAEHAVAEAVKQKDQDYGDLIRMANEEIARLNRWLRAHTTRVDEARREERERHRSAFTGAPHVHCPACVAALDQGKVSG